MNIAKYQSITILIVTHQSIAVIIVLDQSITIIITMDKNYYNTLQYYGTYPYLQVYFC